MTKLEIYDMVTQILSIQRVVLMDGPILPEGVTENEYGKEMRMQRLNTCAQDLLGWQAMRAEYIMRQAESEKDAAK